MKKKKAKIKGPLLMIVWKDHTSKDQWTSKEAAKEEKLEEITSVGWLVDENEERYVIAAGHDEDWAEVDRIATIGKGLVVSKKVLRK